MERAMERSGRSIAQIYDRQERNDGFPDMKRQNGRKHQSLERSPWLLFIPCLLLLGAYAGGFLSSADWRFQDYHYQKGGLVSPDIYVIGIDEETMME